MDSTTKPEKYKYCLILEAKEAVHKYSVQLKLDDPYDVNITNISDDGFLNHGEQIPGYKFTPTANRILDYIAKENICVWMNPLSWSEMTELNCMGVKAWFELESDIILLKLMID